jgi:hypothetical protein
VEIQLDHTELKVGLSFDAAEGVLIEIEASDRDRAYLLFSELKEYLNTEVLVLRKCRSQIGAQLYLMLPMFGIVIFMMSFLLVVTRPPLKLDELKALMAGNDIQAKLNFVITTRSARTEATLLGWFVPSILVLAIAAPCFEWLRNRWYPRNIFYFGKEKHRYDSLLQRRTRWVWGVIVGLIIRFLGSLAVWFLTKG